MKGLPSFLPEKGDWKAGKRKNPVHPGGVKFSAHPAEIRKERNRRIVNGTRTDDFYNHRLRWVKVGVTLEGRKHGPALGLEARLRRVPCPDHGPARGSRGPQR